MHVVLLTLKNEGSEQKKAPLALCVMFCMLQKLPMIVRSKKAYLRFLSWIRHTDRMGYCSLRGSSVSIYGFTFEQILVIFYRSIFCFQMARCPRAETVMVTLTEHSHHRFVRLGEALVCRRSKRVKESYMTLSARGSALEVFLLEDRSSQQRRHESMYVQIFMCFVLATNAC